MSQSPIWTSGKKRKIIFVSSQRVKMSSTKPSRPSLVKSAQRGSYSTLLDMSTWPLWRSFTHSSSHRFLCPSSAHMCEFFWSAAGPIFQELTRFHRFDHRWLWLDWRRLELNFWCSLSLCDLYDLKFCIIAWWRRT